MKKEEDFPTPNDGKVYKPEEDAFILREYGNSPTSEIAKELGRRTSGVSARANALGALYKPVPSDVPEGFKYCRTCKNTLPLDDFFNHAGSKDGKYSVCRTCSSAKKKKARLKEKEDKILAQAKKEKEELEKIIADKDSKTFVCRICGVEKPGTEYTYNKKSKCMDGRCTKCRVDLDKKNKVKRIKDGRDW